MSLNFEAQLGGAIDPSTGLTIRPPRILPASPPRNPDDIEYQYILYRGDDRYYIGLFGDDTMADMNGNRERVLTFDFGRDQVLNSVFRLKRNLSNSDGDFVFLQNLASGLLAVSQSDTNHNYGIRYIALTKLPTLAKQGVRCPDTAKQLSTGEVVLAEIFVPAQTSVAVS